MSTSQHPVALRLERVVGGDGKLLALVMMLPLIDGVFPALILAGALDDPLGAVQVGLLIFGGSATVAVILAEMSGTPREQAKVVLLVGIPLILLAAVQAALAPAIGSMLADEIIKRFAALVILAIAAKTASATIGEYLPGPAVIIGLGLVASIDLSDVTLTVMDDPALVANATLAAAVGVGFALSIALGGPYLRSYMDIDRFRFGSAVALGLLPLSLLGMAFGQAPLAALVVAALFALDVPLERARDSMSAAIDIDGDADGDIDADAAVAADGDGDRESDDEPSAPAVGTGPLPDGGGAGPEESDTDSGDSRPEDGDTDLEDGTEPAERAPWL